MAYIDPSDWVLWNVMCSHPRGSGAARLCLAWLEAVWYFSGDGAGQGYVILKDQPYRSNPSDSCEGRPLYTSWLQSPGNISRLLTVHHEFWIHACKHTLSIKMDTSLECSTRVVRAGHRQWKNWATTDTNNQLPTPDNRHPTTRNLQQSPTATPDNQQSVLHNQHPTTRNKQLAPTDTLYKQNINPTSDQVKQKCEILRLFVSFDENSRKLSKYCCFFAKISRKYFNSYRFCVSK